MPSVYTLGWSVFSRLLSIFSLNCCLLLRFESSLYILYIFWIQMFCWICDWFTNVFFLVCRFSFYFLTNVFHRTKIWIVMKPNLSFFFLYGYSFDIMSGNSWPKSQQWKFLLYFLLKLYYSFRFNIWFYDPIWGFFGKELCLSQG